jgi:hypothetical protein
MIWRCAGAACLLALVGGAPAWGGVLYSRTSTLGGTYAGSAGSEAIVRVGYIATPGNPLPARVLFGNVLWSEGDVGKTITASSDADDPNWSVVVSTMTDRVAEQFGVALTTDAMPTGGGGQTNPEPLEFFGNASDPRVDFRGLTIDNISLTLNSLSITHTGGFTNYSAGVTVMIDGHAVPEPAGVGVVGLGMMVMMGRRRRVRR